MFMTFTEIECRFAWREAAWNYWNDTAWANWLSAQPTETILAIAMVAYEGV